MVEYARIEYVRILGIQPQNNANVCMVSSLLQKEFVKPVPFSGDGSGFVMDPPNPNTLTCNLTDPNTIAIAHTYRDYFRAVYLDGILCGYLDQFTFIHNIVYTEDEDLQMLEVEMILSGGVDVPVNAQYTGNYQGGFFATMEVTSFDASLISANFDANPNRYRFGEYSMLYHDYVMHSANLQHRKTYVPLHVWFPTLEPDGEIEAVNLWVPVPTWSRATAINWQLAPSVVGVCRVWWMKLISGMDAYF